MTTLQEQFEKDFPNKGVRDINVDKKYENSNFTDWSLDLRGYINLVFLGLGWSKITSVNLSECKELRTIILIEDNLTSVQFLNQLPNPEKLVTLLFQNNKIQPTDISIFSRFVNLEVLKIGTTKESLKRGKHNKFYGSLKAYQNLTRLKEICIEATDVNEGLEYLPESLAKKTKGGKYNFIECSPHDTNAKCKAIQDQLRPFNYDLEAWQLANPEKMLIARPELFTNPDSKDKWLKALTDKITNSQKELQEVKEKEADKTKKITRLESKIQELEQVKATISQQTQTEFSTQEKATQTDLTQEQIKAQEKENEQLKEQIKKLEEENNKTWYQKVVDKFKK